MIAASWVVGVVGLVLSIYFYIAGDHKPLLTCAVRPVNTAVVRAGQSSKLAVSYDGKPLVEDVTSAQVAVWNAGDLAIHQALMPLRIYTDPKALILEARLLHATRDVTGMRIDTSELDRGNPIIKWDILEHNDGGVVQIIFTGKSDSKISASAVVEGQRSIHEATGVDYRGVMSATSLLAWLGFATLQIFAAAVKRRKIDSLALRLAASIGFGALGITLIVVGCWPIIHPLLSPSVPPLPF